MRCHCCWIKGIPLGPVLLLCGHVRLRFLCLCNRQFFCWLVKIKLLLCLGEITPKAVYPTSSVSHTQYTINTPMFRPTFVLPALREPHPSEWPCLMSCLAYTQPLVKWTVQIIDFSLLYKKYTRKRGNAANSLGNMDIWIQAGWQVTVSLQTDNVFIVTSRQLWQSLCITDTFPSWQCFLCAFHRISHQTPTSNSPLLSLENALNFTSTPNILSSRS